MNQEIVNKLPFAAAKWSHGSWISFKSIAQNFIKIPAPSASPKWITHIHFIEYTFRRFSQKNLPFSTVWLSAVFQSPVICMPLMTSCWTVFLSSVHLFKEKLFNKFYIEDSITITIECKTSECMNSPFFFTKLRITSIFK